jgi:selenocysteine lyase/cysteine desulfurase
VTTAFIPPKVVFINENEHGSICLKDLEAKLQSYAHETNRVKIGTFCATSNITGIVSEINKITIMLHKYGFLSFWDYATAAPHIEINMNPYVQSEEYYFKFIVFLVISSMKVKNTIFQLRNKELAYKDAVFISTHKFIGGPQTPVN